MNFPSLKRMQSEFWGCYHLLTRANSRTETPPSGQLAISGLCSRSSLHYNHLLPWPSHDLWPLTGAGYHLRPLTLPGSSFFYVATEGRMKKNGDLQGDHRKVSLRS